MSMFQRDGRSKDITQSLKHFEAPRDLDQIPPAPRTRLPEVDVVAEMHVLTEGFKKRDVPADLPEAYRKLIDGIRKGQLDVLDSCRSAVEMSNGLIDQIVGRVREHELYMEREKRIATKLTEKYKGIWEAIEAELADEEKGAGA